MNLAPVSPPKQGVGWRADAACAGAGHELFFSGGSTAEALVRTAAATPVCPSGRCRRECLAFALETNQDFGGWGGASGQGRQLRRGWQAQGRAVC